MAKLGSDLSVCIGAYYSKYLLFSLAREKTKLGGREEKETCCWHCGFCHSFHDCLLSLQDCAFGIYSPRIFPQRISKSRKTCRLSCSLVGGHYYFPVFSCFIFI